MTDDGEILSEVVRFADEVHGRLKWACARIAVLSAILIENGYCTQADLDGMTAAIVADIDQKDAEARDE